MNNTTNRSASLRRRATLGAVSIAALSLPVTLLPVASIAGPPSAAPPRHAHAAPGHLTNLDHLDWLSVTVDPPTQAGHTTYRIQQEPDIGVLWTYAEPNDDGSFRHVGGGAYDEGTNTWSQGAFNADDVTRAAVVYLRHWQATGSRASRTKAYDMLRGVTYLQTASGENAGNVVLWMQPDGTLNPSAEPIELPDPSDSDASYWVARTLWALGEGYAAFRRTDPAFARFLRKRMELSIDAVERQVLDAHGTHLDIDGERAPAWLIADGADATAEAILGLSAYVEAGGSPDSRDALRKLARGVAMLTAGDKQTWPFGSVRPWALSRSIWHGWGSQMPAGLARASESLDAPRLARGAISDSFTFDPWLLTSGGPDNGRMPTRGDASQIAYAADSRLQSLLATYDATGRVAARDLAGIFGAWYFGANPAGEPMYDPATGRTFDGISAEGVINRNSGAESTIHGLLSMLALDANPDVSRATRVNQITLRRGTRTLQAETGTLSGDASAVQPESMWTGESLFSGTGHAALGDGGSVTFDVSRIGRSLVLPVLDLEPGSDAATTFRGNRRLLGRAASGAVGEQGDSPAPGALLPVSLPTMLSKEADTLRARTATTGAPATLDAVMLEPAVSRLVLLGAGHGTALLSSASDRVERTRVRVAGQQRATVETYDARGRLVARRSTPARVVAVAVPAGGFALVTR
ncbi:MAG: hypothetical protein ACXWDL_04545 [Nocardioides sp.]